jgi:hypothetical protein
MIVICINTSRYHLTFGKKYQVEPADPDSLCDFWIVNDRGYKHLVEGSLFVYLEDVRAGRLRLLGI